jgi:two-component system, cell cycle sensor histidine kinase and response regulator CckA
MRARALAVATLVGPAITAAFALRDGHRGLALAAALSALVVLLAVVRFLAVTRGYRHTQERERLLRESAAALVAARDACEIQKLAVDAAYELAIGRGGGRTSFGVGSLEEVEIVAARGDGAEEIMGSRFDIRPLVGEGIHDRSGVRVDAFPSTVGSLVVFPLSVHGERRGVLSVRGDKTLTQPVIDAVRTLGSQVALALESAKRIEERLERTSEDRFRSLVQSSTDVIAILEPDRRIRYHTPSVEIVLGYGPDELVGLPLEELLDERDRGAFLTLFGSLAKEQARPGHLEVRIRHRDGSWRVFDMVLRDLARDPHVGGVVVTGHDVTERRALERQLAHQAFHDPLTGLANRSLFHDRVGHALDRAKRTGGTVATLFIDLDDFKTVNDSLGHAAGDELLVAIGERLREATRPADTAARLGGDEFGVLLEDVDTPADVVTVADRVLEAIVRPLRLRGGRVSVRASIGIAIAGEHETEGDLMRNADTAMYTAKDAGKGRYEVFEPRMHEDARRTRQVRRRERDLYEAIFESTVVGVGIVDGERRVVDCNAAFCQIVARPKEEIIGRNVAEYTADGDDPSADGMERLKRGEIERYTVDKRYIRGDGETVWVRVTTAPVNRHDDLYVGIIVDLSEHERAERQLRERTMLLTHAQRIGGVGSWVFYPAENRDEWSPEAQRIYGFTDEEISRGDPSSFFDIIHPDDREWVMRETFESFASGTSSELEYRIVRRGDGAVRWVRERSGVERHEDGSPLRVLGVVVDITESKLAEEELFAQRELLERAQAAARLGSYSLDVPGRRVTVSREMALVLGAGDEPFEMEIGEFATRFVHENDLLTHAIVASRIYREGGHHSFESRMRRAGGEVIWVRVHGTVELDLLGLPERVIGFVQDVSDEHALEEQLRQAQKLDAVGQLAGGIAHDFNNLLTVIAGNAQLTLIADDMDAVEENTHEILRASQRASELVRGLLAFSRSDAAEPRVLDIDAVVYGVRRMLDRLLEENVEVVVDLEESGAAVLAEQSQLEQILLNLAVNARDAMPGGGRLTLATRADESTVRLLVSDTGFGMDAETSARIFDPFFTTKPRGEGTGLGLSTVYGLVTKAGGQIQVESLVGTGTTFTISLPRVPVDDEDFEEPQPPALAEGRGEHILIVEDEPMVRTIASEILSRAGYTTSVAENGEEALRLFDDGGHFDLVVSDLMMPKLTGPELNERLRESGRAVPTVFMSGYPAGMDLDALDDELTTFVPKPFTGEALAEAVRRQLDLAA